MTGERSAPVVLNKAKVYAALVRDPFCLSMSEIRKLTDYQIFSIYFWPTKKDGALEDVPGQLTVHEVLDPQHLRLQMAHVAAMMNVPSEQINKEFRQRFPGWSI